LSPVPAEHRQQATTAAASLGSSTAPETETETTQSLFPGAQSQLEQQDSSHVSHGVTAAAVRPRNSVDNLGRAAPRASSSTHSLSEPHFHHHQHHHHHHHNHHQHSSPLINTRSRPGGHQRSSSLTSPPPPPADFNPPPDFSSELPLHGISSPQPSSASPNSSSNSVTTVCNPASETGSGRAGDWWAEDLAALRATPPPNMVSSSSSETLLTQRPPQRPQIRAVQRASSESVNRSQHSSASTSSLTGGSSTSDSGEVLAQRRDELVNCILSGEGCEEVQLARARSASSPVASPPLEPTVDLDAVTPTIPLTRLTEQSLQTLEESVQVQAETRGRSRSVSSQTAEETIHAWDSVVSRPRAFLNGGTRLVFFSY